MRKKAPLHFVLTVLLASACTPAQGPEPKAPLSAPTAATPSTPEALGPSADPFAPSLPLLEEAYSTVDGSAAVKGPQPLSPAPQGVPKAPAVCNEMLAKKPSSAAVCATREEALSALDKALTETDATKRDTSLAGLEACAGLTPGLVRALRSDLSSAPCGDVLAEPLLAAPPPGMRQDVSDTLAGQAIAARLLRAGADAPTLAKPYTRDRVLAFVKGPVADWMRRVATAVQDLSGEAAKLKSYGGGVAALAAGTADLRLVEIVRGMPIPDEIANDEDRKNAYYSSLDVELEPRKKRGRDAALVGLMRFAEVGAIRDARVAEARRLLSTLYGGRRVDALDRLLLPALSDKAPGKNGALLAQAPTFYLGLLLDPAVVADADTLNVLASRGLPTPQRRELKKVSSANPALAPVAARARVALGQTYFRAVDFDEALAIASVVPKASQTNELMLTWATALALRGGPRDAAELMAKAPGAVLPEAYLGALDTVANSTSPEAGKAAFDAAYLKELSAPEGAGAAFFTDVERRYRLAAPKLDGAAREEAVKRAQAAAELSVAAAANQK